MADLPALDDAWIISMRGPRAAVDPMRPYALHVEPERARSGRIEDVASVFLTNRECPFRCLMCDLWRHTTTERVPDGAVAAQVEWALSRLPATRHVKLYNAANFFDYRSVPRGDLPDIARRVGRHETVVVECHPRLVGRHCLAFRDLLEGELEIAMGLETADPRVLPRLNKRMTLDDYRRAADFLRANDVFVRAFILVRAPFQSELEGLEWAMRSLDFAFDAGVECCCLIPTRGGNGAMEWLAERGAYAPPAPVSLEAALSYGVRLGRGRVFLDLWDIDRFLPCDHCRTARIERLRYINLHQRLVPAVTCDHCA